MSKKKEKNAIKVLIVEPNEKPYATHIKPKLSSLQTIVDGNIEVYHPPSAKSELIICNKTGKLDKLPLNRPIKYRDEIVEVIAGTFIVVGNAGEDFVSLTDEQIEKYLDIFEAKKCIKEIAQIIDIVKQELCERMYQNA